MSHAPSLHTKQLEWLESGYSRRLSPWHFRTREVMGDEKAKNKSLASAPTTMVDGRYVVIAATA